MGTLDEHWCSVCRKKLDKEKDVYIEFEVVDAKKKRKFPVSLKQKKLKGNLCSECLEKNPDLKKSVEIMLKAGNPLFTPILKCLNSEECKDHEPTFSRPTLSAINCAHICVIGDKLYCNRSHVGSLILPREKGEVEREKGRIMQELLERFIKDPKIKKLLRITLLLKETLGHVYIPPSSVVEEETKSTLADNSNSN